MSMYQNMKQFELIAQSPIYKIMNRRYNHSPFFPHEHLHYVVRTEWHDGVTIYKWMCPYCYTEGADMEEWVEPSGPYFGNPLIDHIMSCDNYGEVIK